jgi:hypothetical protein
MDPGIGEFDRRQLPGQLRELGGGVRGAPPRSPAGGRLELGGNVLVGTVRGEGQVPCSFLVVDHHGSEPRVDLPSFAR